MIRIGLGNRGPHPGVAEVDNRHNRLSRIQHFAFASGAYGDSPSHRSINLGVAQANLSFLKHAFRIGNLGARRLDRILSSSSLMGVRDRCIQISLGSADLLLQRLHQRFLRCQIRLCLHAFLIGGDSLFR